MALDFHEENFSLILRFLLLTYETAETKSLQGALNDPIHAVWNPAHTQTVCGIRSRVCLKGIFWSFEDADCLSAIEISLCRQSHRTKLRIKLRYQVSCVAAQRTGARLIQPLSKQLLHGWTLVQENSHVFFRFSQP